MVNATAVRKALMSPREFSKLSPATTLRPYQAETSQAIVSAIYDPTPDARAVMIFSRQSGKDELLAQLIVYLLLRHSRTGGSIVVVCPTQTPQAAITQDRTYLRAKTHPFTRHLVHQRGEEVRIGRAKATFLGADGNARGQTASICLIANEAQDIAIDRWDAVFAPMTASTNAPVIFSGTLWTANTLLSREMRYARELQEEDGRQRLWLVPWQRVELDHPIYGEHVRARIKQLGANHPFIRTEYELIELDSGATMFTEARLSLLQGTHPRQRAPLAGDRVAFLIDVAGADEAIADGATSDPDSARDSTILTIVAIDHASHDGMARYRVLDRITWVNTPWQTTQGAMGELMVRWKPAMTIVDATGIGHGMWQHLAATHRRSKVEPFVFTSRSKSDIGWMTLGLIDSARVSEYAADDQPDTLEHWWQLAHMTSEIRNGPARILTYGIPASQGHDDSALSFMLIGHLDTMDLKPRIAKGS